MQATPKPTQRRLTTGEENKAPGPHKTAGYEILNIEITTEEQDAVIRVAFHKEYTLLKETELQYTIGKKMPNLVKPRNEALVHPASDLLKAYTTEGFL